VHWQCSLSLLWVRKVEFLRGEEAGGQGLFAYYAAWPAPIAKHMKKTAPIIDANKTHITNVNLKYFLTKRQLSANAIGDVIIKKISVVPTPVSLSWIETERFELTKPASKNKTRPPKQHDTIPEINKRITFSDVLSFSNMSSIINTSDRFARISSNI
jgi:hypothetical protein